MRLRPIRDVNHFLRIELATDVLLLLHGHRVALDIVASVTVESGLQECDRIALGQPAHRVLAR